jgi:hypothetical protein
MIDFFILVILVVIVLYPSILFHFYTVPGKIMLILGILGIANINPLLGSVAGIIYMTHIPSKEGFSPKLKIKHSLLSLDESIRPKNSNRISVERSSPAPSRIELSGNMPSQVENNHTGGYTQF